MKLGEEEARKAARWTESMRLARVWGGVGVVVGLVGFVVLRG